jgi:hypothetical protein
MKKLLIVLSVIALLPSCKEVGPDINLHGNGNVVSDTTYIESPISTPELKNVVMEEFTGVRCPNCPQGHQIIATIKASNPGRVVALSLHPINSLGAPYPFSAQDFRSQKAQSLFDFLVQIGLEPAAAIDRKLFAGESNILLDKNKWSVDVTQQMTQAVPVNVLLGSVYDSLTRELTVIVDLHYTQAVTEENKLTVLLTETNMISAQLDGSIIDTFYTHRDVMRDFITDVQGDAITQTREAGRVVRKVYKKVLDVAWKPENMHIVAYVHEYQNSKRIYQGKEIAVQ